MEEKELMKFLGRVSVFVVPRSRNAGFMTGGMWTGKRPTSN